MRLKHFFLPACLLLAVTLNAQSITENKPATIFTFVEQMPVAGYDLNKFIAENLHYPDTAMRYNIQGRLITKFTVNEDGSISDCIVIKGIGGGCDEEALRVVKSMPAWQPGMQKGKPVKVNFTLPIVFKLQD